LIVTFIKKEDCSEKGGLFFERLGVGI